MWVRVLASPGLRISFFRHLGFTWTRQPLAFVPAAMSSAPTRGAGVFLEALARLNYLLRVRPGLQGVKEKENGDLGRWGRETYV